jgi:hypothetical protein
MPHQQARELKWRPARLASPRDAMDVETPAAPASGLRRLSMRAAPRPRPSSESSQDRLHSFAPVAAAVLAHLRASGVADLAVLPPGPLARVPQRRRMLLAATRLLPPMR